MVKKNKFVFIPSWHSSTIKEAKEKAGKNNFSKLISLIMQEYLKKK